MMRGYRRDIDGLRAVAVLPVVLFHAGVPIFSGGYVGVDIFFVISGFLITGILMQDGGRLSILSFYNRRIRRIFPALFAMLALVTAAALILLTPLDLKSYGASLGSTALFASNIYFYLGSGYFEASAIDKPLLHTWSLAVEEQFYIVWPVALWAMHRLRGRAMLTVTLIALLVSFGLSVWQTGRNPDAGFFLPHTRFWELLLGAVLAMRPIEVSSRPLREAISALGLGLIALAVFTFDGSTVFPGWAAAIPCLGAAMLIVGNARGDTAAARLLSLRPAVFVGLISYSLYLWHWPLLSLGHYVALRPLHWHEAAALVALSFVLATLSWRFVEKPFRHGAGAAKAWKRSIPLGALATVLALTAAAPLYLSKGLPQRSPAAVIKAEQIKNRTGPGACDALRPIPKCHLGAPGDAVSVLLWGDSHAGAFAPGVDSAAASAGLSGLQVNSPACAPLLGARRLDAEGSADCVANNNDVLKLVAGHPELHTVVLIARWALLAETTRFGDEEGAPAFLADDKDDTASLANNRRVLAEGLERTVTTLQRTRPGVRVILVGQAPEPGVNAAKCLARAIHLKRPQERCRSVSEPMVRERLAYADGVLRQVAGKTGAELFMLSDRMCAEGRCPTVEGETILYRDDDHLSPDGARLVARDLPLSPQSKP
jgi:peptidoglycan/LPS O-acetylase OafA/YrhL